MQSVQALGSMVTSLHTDQEISVSIPGYAVEFFSIGELFHCVYGRPVSVFIFCRFLSLFFLFFEEEEAPALTSDQGGLSVISLSYTWSIETLENLHFFR